MAIKLLILATVFVATLVIINFVVLWRNTDLHVYPAVTRCRVCGCRIWVWQSYERREFKVDAENPEHLAVAIGMSGLIHCSCEGTPETKVKITSHSISMPTLGVKEAMDVSIIQRTHSE